MKIVCNMNFRFFLNAFIITIPVATNIQQPIFATSSSLSMIVSQTVGSFVSIVRIRQNSEQSSTLQTLSAPGLQVRLLVGVTGTNNFTIVRKRKERERKNKKEKTIRAETFKCGEKN